MNRRRVGKLGARTVSRLALILGLVLVALTPLLVLAEDSPYTTITPQTPQASADNDVYRLLFWLALAVFVGVEIFLIFVAMKYRRRQHDPRPEQLHGHKTLEMVWTIIPAVVLFAIFIPTVQNIFDFADAAKQEEGDYVVEVYGKQWWWEVHYKEPDTVANVITANEIHLPQGQKVIFKFYSNNVIHSFWVPQLSGKMDVVPGHENKIGIDTTNTGYFWGQCAEFCGDSHALMRLKVVVQPQAEFDAWIKGFSEGPSQDALQYTSDIAAAPESLSICLTCHMIEGVTKNSAGGDAPNLPTGLQAAKTFGPNLAMFACRTTIAAGTLVNDPEGINLKTWLHDPGAVKPGNYMSTVIQKGTLTDEQIDEIVAYLQTLHPAEGCSELPDRTDGTNNIEPESG